MKIILKAHQENGEDVNLTLSNEEFEANFISLNVEDKVVEVSVTELIGALKAFNYYWKELNPQNYD